MPRLVIESDSYKRPPLYKEAIKDWLPMLFSLSAILLSIFQPFQERDKERKNDLLSYRNLACFAVRYIDKSVPEVIAGKSSDDIQIETIEYSVNQIKVTELPDPSLVEGFVIIRNSTAALRAWTKADAAKSRTDKTQLTEAKSHADDAMQKINDYIKQKKLSTKTFAVGCDYNG